MLFKCCFTAILIRVNIFPLFLLCHSSVKSQSVAGRQTGETANEYGNRRNARCLPERLAGEAGKQPGETYALRVERQPPGRPSSSFAPSDHTDSRRRPSDGQTRNCYLLFQFLNVTIQQIFNSKVNQHNLTTSGSAPFAYMFILSNEIFV